MSKVVLAIQSRMASSRILEKPFKAIAGKKLLDLMWHRSGLVFGVDQRMIAMTSDESDDVLAEYSVSQKYPFSRGPVDDIAGRLHKCVEETHADALLRVWGDCPFICNEVIQPMIDSVISGECDFATNSVPATFPFGMNVEVYSKLTLQRLMSETEDPFYREFPVEYVKANASLRLKNFTSDQDDSAIKLTVDYPQDADRAEIVFNAVGLDAGYLKVVDFCRKNSEIFDEANTLPRNIEYEEKREARGLS